MAGRNVHFHETTSNFNLASIHATLVAQHLDTADVTFSRLTLLKGEPELTDPFNLLINVKLRMLWNWNFFYLKEHFFYGNIVS